MPSVVDRSPLRPYWGSASALILEAAAGGCVLAVSPPLARVLAPHGAAAYEGRQAEDLFADGAAWRALLAVLAERATLDALPVELIDAEGEPVPAEVSGRCDAQGVLTLLVRDLRGEPVRLRAHRQEHEQLRELIEHAADIVYRTDLQGRFCYVNPAGARVLGWTPEELRDMSYGELLPEGARSTARRFYVRQLRELIANTYNEVPIVTRGGHEIWLGQNVQLVFESGRVSGFQAVAREITDRKRREEQLAHRATHDSLTRLFNRSFFEAQLDKSIAESVRHGQLGAVLIVDLDRFKEVNDRFGHRVGDAYLEGFGRLLERRFRESDVVARYGGDEFAILLDRPRLDALDDLADELLSRIRHYAITADERAATTASIGIALFPAHGSSREAVLARADHAMYQAKQRGRNRYCIFEPDGGEDPEPDRGRSRHLESVRGALEARDFELYAQPVTSLRDGSLLFHEILLRLREADGTLLEAGSFLGLAERVGTLHEIDRWVVARLLDALADARGREDLVFGVNLAAPSVGDAGILSLVRQRLRRARLAPSRLIFEITESAAIGDLRRAVDFMGELNRLGCRFALDDFGVGFSSLYRLKELPVDFLKIDGNFVRGLAGDRADRALVRAIVEVAAALGRQTIAEFVEDEATERALREAGVDYAQGFYIGRSVPLEEVLTGSAVVGVR